MKESRIDLSRAVRIFFTDTISNRICQTPNKGLKVEGSLRLRIEVKSLAFSLESL
ncbi:MAG: hypothetical protein HXY46_12745 [Syntrophaceae bacterium]|nr:hypothetical protein [Syntrophaceae bacterium]